MALFYKIVLALIVLAAVVFGVQKIGGITPGSQTTTDQGTVSTQDKLDLSGRGLTSVPMSAFENTRLEELDVSNNALTGALPSQIGQLRSLKVLRAQNNHMTGVPAEVGKLSNLEILDLSNNDLTGLPLELGNLSNLKVLNLSGNAYAEADLAQIRAKLPNTQFILK